jgi:hypothetical protein
MRDESASHVNQGQVVSADRFLANAERAEVVVPAVRALDDPATRTTANVAQKRWLTAAPNMRTNAAATDVTLGVRVVVALVEAEVLRSPFGTKLAAIGRIWPREAPPLGAFTEALSREVQVQSMPRSAS